MTSIKSNSSVDKLLVTMLAISLGANIWLARKIRSLSNPAGHLATQVTERVSAAAMAEISANDAPSKGETSAPVTLVVFSDYQCPFCRQFAATLNDAEVREGDKLKVVARSFPLSIHSGAKGDAELAACVARQNNTEFWQLYDFFYSRESPTVDQGTSFLRSRGVVNLDELHTCLERQQADAQVERDIQLGRKYGVHATPTFFVNGVRVIGGTSSSDDLVRIIDGQSKAFGSASSRTGLSRRATDPKG